MKAVIIANEKSSWDLCGKSVIERLIEELGYHFDEIYVYPARYRRIVKDENVKFLRSLRDFKERAFVVKGNAFIEELKLDGNIFRGEDGKIIAYIGKPSKRFDRKGRGKRIKGFEIEERKDIEKAVKLLTQKESRDIVATYICGKIASFLSPSLCKAGYSSLQLYLVSFLLAFLSFLFYIPSKYIFAVFAGIFAIVSGVMEESGRTIAILRNEREFFAINIFSDFMIILGFTYFAWKIYGGVVPWILGFVAAMGMAGVEAIKAEGIIGRHLFILIIFIASIFYQPTMALLLLAIIMNGEAVRRMVK